MRQRFLRPCLSQDDDDAPAARRDMNDAQRVDYYRQEAEEISQLARRSRNTSVRLELLQIAELFERMADRAERRIRAD